MLELVVSNGEAYVWTAEDWYTLRNEHGIIGCFDGAQRISDSNQTLLPFKLSTVETQFLIKTGIASTVEVPTLKELTAATTEVAFQDMRKKRAEVRILKFKEKKRSEIESIVDKIMEGKRKKGKVILPDRNTVIQDELDKIKQFPSELVTFDLVDLWTPAPIPYDFPEPSTPLDILRLRVFEDFRSVRKYYITSGVKFGGDFLAYPGDPRTHHSQYIIICQTIERQIPNIFIISQSRLAQCVKKILLIATLDGQKLNYKKVRQTK